MEHDVGADFVEKAIRSFKKSWDNGRVMLATADLLTQEPDCKARTFAADIERGWRPTTGENVTVEKEQTSLVVRKGHAEVARTDDPPPALLAAVEQSCGIAKGTVEVVHEVAGVAEISLC